MLKKFITSTFISITTLLLLSVSSYAQEVTGSIKKGDLLTSSAMSGHAMAGEFKGGAMIGKALEDFDGESGVIEVLVNLM